MVKKLSALNKVAMHIGLIAPCEALAIKKEVLASRIEQYGTIFIIGAACVLMDENSSNIQKAVAGKLLECFFPKWRDEFPRSIVGGVVDRNSKEVLDWKKEVICRCGKECVVCGSKENIHVHHVVRWVDAPSLRVEPSNGVTLCKKCHDEAHRA